MYRSLPIIAFSAVILATAQAHANMPVFSAECPQANYIDADISGAVRVNGAVAQLEKFNDQYYEARQGGVTYSISHDADGSGLQVSYNPPGSAGGYCTILSSTTTPSGNAVSGNMVQVTGVPANDVLNVRQRPTPRAPIVGALNNGTTVRNLGCENLGQSTWCQVQFLDDMGGGGWVNARYLSIGGVVTQLPETVPPQPSGAGETRTVQVSFPSGMTGTELRGSIAPGGSVRYVLNARNGQDLYVRVVGQGLSYQIFNPDKSFLLDQVSTSQEYRGQLWQSGNHVIEVINRSNQTLSYNVIFGIN